ncbi:hybrid sensor histidine kinase/response regulator [Luteibacter rhizovicinus DSM 16549]|uniref:histidine kinase n=2 Tax=Luteibacter rhizovicinus TaxID=242606 RepID=A0A0G9HBD0_9GAMM|nr:hybrid sensor histidine kinase/response regulator [Luteibacter rhizovicinus DSM 16549]KLD66928.1 histidine kinase [Luteibacter rhizovicinus DSM 16549]
MNTHRDSARMDDSAYRRLVEGISDYAIFWLEPGGAVATWNAGALHATGYSAADMIGQPFSLLFSGEDNGTGAPEALLDTALREGRSELDGWLLRKDGSRFWAQILIDPVRDGDTPLGFGVVMRDRTERKRLDEELRRSQEQFRVLVQGVADYAIYMLDPGGHITSWNSGAERIKGYAPEEVIGRHYSAFFTPDDVARGEPTTNLEAVAREGRIETEGWRLRKDGSRFWAHVVIDRITDDTGKLIGFAKVTRDVTERRASAQALEQAREALFQSQKLEAVGQLTGGVAHDFNNLLMAVQGNLELMRDHAELPERLNRLVGNALTGVRRGVSLTQRMLAFARRQQLHLEPVNVVTLVSGMSDLLRTSLGPSIAIEVRFPLALPDVMGDINQLELCVLNLCVNARDAMGEGGIISIQAATEAIGTAHLLHLAPGDYVRLSIADNGSGMDATTLARATEPFFTTKGVGKGTGLGLSMVHGIVQQSGGALQLESGDAGTTVSIYLPVAPSEATALPVSTPTEPRRVNRQAVDVKGPLPVILVVDDDPLVLSTAVEMLNYAGYDARGAASANEALRRLETIDELVAVVTDHAMPGMTGSELAARLATIRPGLRVVLASGYSELPTAAPGIAVQLQKPFGRDALLAAIRGNG